MLPKRSKSWLMCLTLHVRCRDRVSFVELRCRLCLTSKPALLVQGMLCSFGHSARLPNGELIKNLLLPTPPRAWRWRTESQLKTWTATIEVDLEPLSGPRVFRVRKDWVKVSSEFARNRRVWDASVRDVAISISDAGSTRPGECQQKFK